MIHGAWSTTEQADESIISHVLTIWERLEKMKDIVRVNLEEARGYRRRHMNKGLKNVPLRNEIGYWYYCQLLLTS